MIIKKILCVCERGNSRSVALAWLLKEIGHEALAIGMYTSSRETQKMLFEWADTIIVVDAQISFPIECVKKITVWDVGKDQYFRSFSPELIRQFITYMKKDNEIR